MTFTPDNDLTASGAITTQNLVPAGVATVNSSVEIACNSKGSALVQVVGTWTGVLSLQATIDGANWVTIGMASAVKSVAADSYAATIPSASPGIYLVTCAGYFKIRVTALGVTTGTANITINLTRATRTTTIDSGLPPGAQVLGSVSLQNATTQGASRHTLTAAATTNSTLVKAGAATLYAHVISNKALTGMWVKFYDKASAPTVGTDTPVLQFLIPASTSLSLNFGPTGIKFTSGLGFGFTGGDALNDTTAVAAAQAYSTVVYA